MMYDLHEYRESCTKAWRFNQVVHCLLQVGMIEAVEDSTPFPLRRHSVHIPETAVVALHADCPFRVVLSLFPCQCTVELY